MNHSDTCCEKCLATTEQTSAYDKIIYTVRYCKDPVCKCHVVPCHQPAQEKRKQALDDIVGMGGDEFPRQEEGWEKELAPYWPHDASPEGFSNIKAFIARKIAEAREKKTGICREIFVDEVDWAECGMSEEDARERFYDALREAITNTA